MNDWMFLPPWAMQVVITATLVLLGIALFRAYRESRTVGLKRQWPAIALRTLLIVLLVLVALNPTAIQPRELDGKPKLTVLIDTSYSMSTADEEGKSRLEAALALFNDPSVRSRLEGELDLQIQQFDLASAQTHLDRLTADSAIGTGSDLASAINLAVTRQGGEQSQAGVLIISDGQATTEGALDAARLALARSVPLWTWTLGGPVDRKDIWVELSGSEVLAFADSDVQLNATLHQIGYDDRSLIVELWNGDERIDSVEVAPGPTGSAPVSFSVRAPAEGENQYTFRAIAQRDESQTQNNDRSVFLRSVGQKVRVLVVEGQPHWDTKFLVQSLKRNERVDMTAIYRLNDKRQFAVVSAGGDEQSREQKDLFPRTSEAFNQYDVIIMGRGCEAFFDDNTDRFLTEFVAQNGGSLIFSRGKSYGGRFVSLAKFEPVVWGSGVSQGVRIAPTATGNDSSVFELSTDGKIEDLLDRLPRFDLMANTLGVKPLAVVLAHAEIPSNAAGDSPVMMAYHLYGQGRVVVLNASGVWRWAFREKGEQSDEFVYDRFWSGLMRWLLSGSDFLAGHDIALRSDRRLYTDEQPMRFMIKTRSIDQEAYRPQITIQGDDGQTMIEPRMQDGGFYIAEAGPFAPGVYQVTLSNNLGAPEQLQTTVEVVSGSLENRVLSSNPALMEHLSQISGGQVLTGSDVAKLDVIVRDWHTRTQLAEDKRTLWDRTWILVLIVGLLAGEWYFRRREGLI